MTPHTIAMNTFYLLPCVVLLSRLAHAQNVVLHPGQCRSVPLSDEVRVTCLHVNFTHLPIKSFPSNTTNLNVSYSNLSSITLDDLKLLPDLTDLSLIKNQLKTLPADLLKGLSNLQLLDLTGTTQTLSKIFEYCFGV